VSPTLLVHEIYLSLQGESTFAGLPCVFVRLTGCDLRCSYCDTAYAFRGGAVQPVEAVVARVAELASGFAGPARLPLVELTGGEPLLQKGSLPLMRELCDAGFTVLIETSGAHDIGGIDPRVRRIVDLKCPGSGESEKVRWQNIPLLKGTDEIKFVLCSREDYEWARTTVATHRLNEICPVLFSWAAPLTAAQSDPSLKPLPAGHHPADRRQLAEWIIRDRLPVRFQLQLHKFIWPADERGV
jgi:7-carboxy-7-deazaguanine synthase